MGGITERLIPSSPWNVTLGQGRGEQRVGGHCLDVVCGPGGQPALALKVGVEA